ncbi:NAD(P)/FAD-dependent oxidoreductase [Nocardia sp. NPDC004168]|uniref:phytoene desaturase family protein n=1 Tax=Nocardia sp. NPDC004168 TaxID=3154452 RepID=UPI0033B3E778
MSDYDVIVIGAGNAGLTAAATLQRAGTRTLLLERHNVPGGCGTSFRRGRFEFEVALHQLSGVGVQGQPASLREGLFTELGIVDRVEFVQEQELYRAIIPGRLDVTLPADWGAAVEVLEARFPGNRTRLQQFFELVKKVTFWQLAAMRGMHAEKIEPVLFAYGLRPLKDVLDEYFVDELLKFALGIYWGYLGQPPSKLCFQDFAIMLFAYFEFKPWHIRGGSQAMSTAILDVFIQAGGTVLFNTEVTAILASEKGVHGVRLEDGNEVTASDVISNASLPTTYGMVENYDMPTAVRDDLSTRLVGVSAFVLHMGLDTTPAELGFTTSTNFVNLDTDDDRTFAAARSFKPARGVAVSSYDVAPIGFSPAGATHISLMSLHYADAWNKVRPDEYSRVKFAYAETLLNMCEYITPGIRDSIEEIDVATPLTVMRYLGHPGGSIYGYEQDRTDGWLFRDNERESHIPGLHLVGAWTGIGGFQPTLAAGARVAQNLLCMKSA